MMKYEDTREFFQLLMKEKDSDWKNIGKILRIVFHGCSILRLEINLSKNLLCLYLC